MKKTRLNEILTDYNFIETYHLQAVGLELKVQKNTDCSSVGNDGL